MKSFVLTTAAVTGTCLFAGGASAQLVGLWEFENASDLGAATIGSDLATTGPISAIAGSGGTDTGAASVGIGDFFTASNPIGPNGGGTNTNQYSIVMDINTITDGFQSLLDQESVNFDDGDLFLNGSGIGISSDYSGTVPSGAWTRIVAVYDLTLPTEPITLYIDGALANVIDSPAGDPTTVDLSFDGRHSLLSTFDILSDNGGDEEAITGLSNLALYSTPLSASDVATLGAAGDAITNFRVPGDANGDGNVSLTDLDILGQNFGGPGGLEDGDFNGDGTISLADLDILGQNFGTTTSPPSASLAVAVPEPTSLALLGLGGLLVARRRRG